MGDAAADFRAAVAAALGHAPDLIEPGRLQRFPTSDKPGDRAGWCKLFPDLRGGVYGCNRAGLSDTWRSDTGRPVTRQQRAEYARQVAQAAAARERQQREQWAANAQRIARLWAECRPLQPDDPVARYLARRLGAEAWPMPACLRLHPALACWDGEQRIGTFPAMVAPLVAPDGRMVALHRTYLTAEGRKADVPTVKKLTATAGPLGGACIPLGRPVHGAIGIAEGIETALAAAMASSLPTVAAYSAGNLAAWQWPAGLRRLVIFGDADRAGREAADSLRARALLAGLRVDVMTPTDDGADWCDVWAGRSPPTIEVRAAA